MDDERVNDRCRAEEPRPRTGLSRRRLIGGALAGACTIPLAACDDDDSGLDRSTGSGSPPDTGSGGGDGGGSTTTTTTSVPTAEAETWNEPWVWRPSDFPLESLELNVVENQNPGATIGFGNPFSVLFSYGGNTPGPTIRTRGDGIVAVKLRNLLGLDLGTTYVGPFPDAATLTGYLPADRIEDPELASGEVTDQPLTVELTRDRAAQIGNKRSDFCLGEHTNGVHSVHTTNLHTHGLHVRPGRNDDSTHSDNVILRLIPQQDLAARETAVGQNDIECRFLREGDQINFLEDDDEVGQADYQFRLGSVQGDPDQPHPPGTHWYHPHAHGATAQQVSSGMAGFLIVEGDVDDAVREALVPDRENDPGDPAIKTGPNGYRERLMLIQRVFNVPTDPDAPIESLQKNNRVSSDALNGSEGARSIFMRPNATERWRVLNGSVDGKGYRRIMVLEDRWEAIDGRIARAGTGEPATRDEVEAAKQRIWQLSFDGVTLVGPDGEYYIKDLDDQGDPDAAFPLGRLPEGTFADKARWYAECFTDGDTIRNSYVRPREVYLGPANRTDLFFQAPPLEDGEDLAEYTVIALGVILHADTPLQAFQQNVMASYARDLTGQPKQKNVQPPAGPGDVVIARLRVTGTPTVEEPFDLSSIDLPPVPPYLQPIGDDEEGLRAPDGGFRTRTVTYSGWGAASLPLVTTKVMIDAAGNVDPDTSADNGVDPTKEAFAEFIRSNPDLEGLRFVRRFESTGAGPADFVLLAPNTRTMAIDGKKFDPNDPGRPRMYLGSTEEWAVYNNSDFLWGNTGGTDPDALPPAQFGSQYDGLIRSLAEGMAEFEADNAFQILSRAVDHPFHIHQNPFWVMRIDVPDADGRLHNILAEPRWQDVVPIPRHRGRVVFRSRFPDYVGTYVHHCHILLHEDNGMMQPVEVTPFDQRGEPAPEDEVARANYVVRDGLARGGLSDDATDEVDKLYGRPVPSAAYLANVSFADDNHTTGQIYPGFEIAPPTG